MQLAESLEWNKVMDGLGILAGLHSKWSVIKVSERARDGREGGEGRGAGLFPI